jgi:transposase
MAQGNRLFINAVFWIMRSGAPWRDLPPDFGGWGNTHRRFIRWRDSGVWERLPEILIDNPDFEWLMIDASRGHICQKRQLLSRICSNSVHFYELQSRD